MILCHAILYYIMACYIILYEYYIIYVYILHLAISAIQCLEHTFIGLLVISQAIVIGYITLFHYV